MKKKTLLFVLPIAALIMGGCTLNIDPNGGKTVDPDQQEEERKEDKEEVAVEDETFISAYECGLEGTDTTSTFDIKGVVLGKRQDAEWYVQSGSYGIVAYSGELGGKGFAAGKEVKFTTAMKNYNGTIEADPIDLDSVEVLGDKSLPASVKVTTNEQLAGLKQNIRVDIEGTLAETPASIDLTKDLTLKITVGEDTIPVFFKKNTYGSLKDTLQTLVAGNSLKIENCVTGVYKPKSGDPVYQLLVMSETTLTKQDGGVTPDVAVTGVTLNKNEVSIGKGNFVTLVATVAPGNATNKNVTWSCEPASVATVDQSGKVTAVEVGTATVTVTTVDGSKTATCTVTVTETQEEVNYGTLDAPINVTEALAIARNEATTTDAFTSSAMFIQGTIETSGDTFHNNGYFGKFKLVTGDDKLLIANTKMVEGGVDTTNLTNGDVIVVKGFIKNDATAGLEVIKASDNVYPSVEKIVSRAPATINVVSEHATVTGVTDGSSHAIGSTINFTVVVDEGYVLVEVKFGTTLLEDNDGTYSLVVNGPGTITVVTKSATDESETLIVDGTTLASDASTEEADYKIGDITYTISKGAKATNSAGTNRFSDKAILIGKTGAYIYNKDAIPGKITKFEIYSNKGASANVTVGVNFSDSKISEFNADASNTYSAKLDTADNIYDISDKLTTNCSYFWFQITNNYNAQVEFRITYIPTK